MKPFLAGLTRLSGLVKLRCRLSLGSAVTGLDLRPGRPLPPSPEPSSSGFEAALALASASSAALAVRDLLQPLLFVGHPLRHLVATLRGSELTILSLVGLGGLSQPALDLRRKPRLRRFHPAIAHRLVDPGIGLDLGAVERHMAKLHEPRLATQRKNLPEQSGERSQMPLAELADRAEVRTLHPRYCRKIQPLRAAPRDLARRVDPLAVRIKQQRHHHPTMT